MKRSGLGATCFFSFQNGNLEISWPDLGIECLDAAWGILAFGFVKTCIGMVGNTWLVKVDCFSRYIVQHHLPMIETMKSCSFRHFHTYDIQ